MKSLWIFVSASIALGGMTAHADDAGTIRALRMQSNEAIRRHDADAVGSYLHDDYVITISTGAIERSRDEHVRSFRQHFADYPDVGYIRTPVEITLSESYPLAIEHGTWLGTRTSETGALESGGRYTAAWRKTDSGWKIYSELFVALYCKGAGC